MERSVGRTSVEFHEVPTELRGLVERLRPILEKLADVELGGKGLRGVVNFIFVDSEQISVLNETYRGKQGPTDVLTFVYDSEDTNEDDENNGPVAEAYVCLNVIEENAVEFGNPFEVELVTVLVHSLLHMAGYDHEYGDSGSVEMFSKQDRYVGEIREVLGL